MMTLEHATTSTGGGFSRPSKMPCPAYSIPASLCKVGGKLRKVEGSVCGKCYAMKGNYNYPAVRAALARRLGVQVSTVVTSGKTCPSAEQGNKCLTCRACWDKKTECVAYGKD